LVTKGAKTFSIYEFVVVLILLSPLMITVLVLTVNFISAGIRDLRDFLGKSKQKPEAPTLTESDAPESEVEQYIQELKKKKT